MGELVRTEAASRPCMREVAEELCSMMRTSEAQQQARSEAQHAAYSTSHTVQLEQALSEYERGL